MKIGSRVAVAAALLIVIGVVVAAYSYTQLQGQDVMFDQDSIPVDGHSYLSYEIIVDLDGKLAPKVVGGVGSVGSGVDFYVVNYTSWNSWSTNPGSRSAFSMVHINSSAVSSQLLAEDQFSFIPSTNAGYFAVFVNDWYPSANNASVHATIILRYIYLSSIYAFVTGLVMIVVGFVLLMVRGFMRQGRRGRTPPMLL